MKILHTFIIAAIMTSFATPSFAKFLGDHGNWQAYQEKEKGNKACVMSSVPLKSVGKYNKRGDVYAVIAHRPSENRIGEVSIQAGYTFKKGRDVNVIIDGKTSFTLFTNGSYAWATDSQGDQDLVRAMQKGNSMVVKGVSSRGTKTTDTFSLKGFSAALKSINSSCGVTSFPLRK